MTTPIENSKIEYNKVQVPNYDGTEVQYLNSAFAAPQNYAVQNGNSVGEMLASGEVNQAENVTASQTENTRTNEGSKTSNGSSSSLYGVSVSTLRNTILSNGIGVDTIVNTILMDMTLDEMKSLVGNNLEIKQEDIGTNKEEQHYKQYLKKHKELLVNSLSDEKIIEYFNENIEQVKKQCLFKDYVLPGLSDDEKEKIFNKIIVPKLLKEGSDCTSLLSQIDIAIELQGKEKILNDPKSADAIIYTYTTLCDSGNSNLINNKNGLAEELGSDFMKLDAQAQFDAIMKHLDDVAGNSRQLNDPQYSAAWLGELSRLALCSKTANEKNIIANFILCDAFKEKLKAMNTSEDGDKTTAELLNIIRNSCETADMKREVDDNLAKQTEKLPKETIDAIVKEFGPGGYLNNTLSDEEKARFQEIKVKMDRGEEVSEEDVKFFEECKEKCDKVREIAENVTKGIATRTGEGGDFTEEEAKGAIGSVSDGVANIDEGTYREYLQNLHEWYQENGESLNLTPEQFEELMNGATHGNYNTVVEDILRGDGVQTPLNMPETTGSSSYNNSGSSAINPETGFFNTQPQSVIYNSQNSLAELRKSIVESSALDTTPQLVKNDSAQSIIQTGGDKKVSLLTKYKQKVGNLSFVKEIFNNKVNLRDVLAVNMALNSFENMGKSMKILTFERISNTSGALLATEAMSTKEKSEVHAQNIYIAESLAQQIEDEKKKQQA